MKRLIRAALVAATVVLGGCTADGLFGPTEIPPIEEEEMMGC